MADGVWIHEPYAHALPLRSKDNIRALTSNQDFVAAGALDLIHVAHHERMEEVSPDERRRYAGVEARLHRPERLLFYDTEGQAVGFPCGGLSATRTGSTARRPTARGLRVSEPPKFNSHRQAFVA